KSRPDKAITCKMSATRIYPRAGATPPRRRFSLVPICPIQGDGGIRLPWSPMTVHLVNPSHLSFGVGVITPRWLFVLGAATPAAYGRPRISDETLEPFDMDSLQSGDVVGIGIHTGNALRGYEIGKAARERGATVIFGGSHAT